MLNNDVCYICGKLFDSNTQITTEHCLPKQLYKRPRPNNLITLKACFDCNNKYSKDEEYFTDTVLLQVAKLNPYASELWESRIIDIHNHAVKKPRYRQFLRNNLTGALSIYSPGGIYLGDANGTKVKIDRIINVIEKIVKWLYFKHINNMMKLDEFTMNVKVVPNYNDEIKELINFSEKIVIHPEVFTYCYLNTKEKDSFGIFMHLVFYNNFTCTVFIMM